MRTIVLHGIVVAATFSGIAMLSPRLDVSSALKPVDAAAAFTFVGLMLAAGIVWCSAVRTISRRAESTRGEFWTVVGFAILFRAIVFISPPILELDVYRYMWDGFVSASGFDPYRYSPSEIFEAVRFGDLEVDPEKRLIAKMVDGDSDAKEILDRVHYPDLPTIYPPVAQALFRTSQKASRGKSLGARLATIKGLLILCESAALALVAGMLRKLGRSSNLILIPAWCPIAVISIANQGHLDSLPALLTTAALASLIFAPQLGAIVVSGVLLGLACGSKIYPAVLSPVILAFLWRRPEAETRFSRLSIFVVAFIGVSGFVWSPLLKQDARTDGFAAFAGQWEMYDSFFAVASTNLTPHKAGDSIPWFSVAPESFKRLIPRPARTSRFLWIVSVGVIACLLMRRLWSYPDVEALFESNFILLAWFWALGPVCNPWYLEWLVPLLPFLRNSGWKAMFVVAPFFYLRLGMIAKFGATAERWFDEVVVFALTGVWVIAVLNGGRANHLLKSNSTGTMTFSDPDRNPSKSTLT